MNAKNLFLVCGSSTEPNANEIIHEVKLLRGGVDRKGKFPYYMRPAILPSTKIYDMDFIHKILASVGGDSTKQFIRHMRPDPHKLCYEQDAENITRVFEVYQNCIFICPPEPKWIRRLIEYFPKINTRMSFDARELPTAKNKCQIMHLSASN